MEAGNNNSVVNTSSDKSKIQHLNYGRSLLSAGQARINRKISQYLPNDMENFVEWMGVDWMVD